MTTSASVTSTSTSSPTSTRRTASGAKQTERLQTEDVHSAAGSRVRRQRFLPRTNKARLLQFVVFSGSVTAGKGIFLSRTVFGDVVVQREVP